MGTAMFAPDYTQWHGFFEVAERFYMEFIPQVEEIISANLGNDETKLKAANEVKTLLEKTLNQPDHLWFSGKEPDEVKKARLKAMEEFKKRYAD